MNAFRFWRWALKPEQPAIMHVVKDQLPGALSVELATRVASTPSPPPADEASQDSPVIQPRR